MIKTTDKNLILYLQTKFNKKIENITELELQSIEVLSLDSKYIDGTLNKIDFKALQLFPNLKILNINNSVLTNEDLTFMATSKIQELNLTKCAFKDNFDYKNLNKILCLSMNNCYIEDYSLLLKNICNIKKLQISKPYDDNIVDVNLINKQILILILEQCNIKNSTQFENMHTCYMMSLLDTNLDCEDLYFINKMTSLKYIILSKKYQYKAQQASINSNIQIDYNLNRYVYENIQARER